MSYATRVTGNMDIIPPLKWGDYHHTIIETLGEGVDNRSPFRVVERVETTYIDEGVLTRRWATSIVAESEGFDYRADAFSELRLLAKAVWMGGARLVGTFYVEGEHGALDVHRLWVEWHDNGFTVHDELALLVWPDGTAAYVKAPAPFATEENPVTCSVLGNGEQVFRELNT